MIITGIGIDIEEIARFRKLPYARNASFYKKIFTKQEIAYCRASSDPAASFTARFAAKEACVKAAGGAVKTVREVEIIMRKNRPTISMKKGKIFLSLSHTNVYAIAIALCAR